jgi:hypothetical protein
LKSLPGSGEHRHQGKQPAGDHHSPVRETPTGHARHYRLSGMSGILAVAAASPNLGKMCSALLALAAASASPSASWWALRNSWPAEQMFLADLGGLATAEQEDNDNHQDDDSVYQNNDSVRPENVSNHGDSLSWLRVRVGL